MKRFPKFSVIQVQKPLNVKDDTQVSGHKTSLSCQKLSDTVLQELLSLGFIS